MSDTSPAYLDNGPPADDSNYGRVGTLNSNNRPSEPRDVAGSDDRYLAGFDDTEQEMMMTLRSSLYPGASWPSIQMVMTYCRLNQIDPFLKAVHIVPMSVKVAGTRDRYEWRDVLMPGIADYRIKASRSGTYAGKTEPEFGPMIELTLSGATIRVPEFCKITVTRLVHGQPAQFTALEYWEENYATAKRDTQRPNAMWGRRPRGQLAKCAEAQALRMAFPELNGGQATFEEMEGKFETFQADAAPAALPAPGTKLQTLEDELGKADRRVPADASGPRMMTEQKAAGAAAAGGNGKAPAAQPMTRRAWADTQVAEIAVLSSHDEIVAFRSSTEFKERYNKLRETESPLVGEIDAAFSARMQELGPPSDSDFPEDRV